MSTINGSKIKISKKEYMQRATLIINNSKLADDLKMLSLLELASKFEIATEEEAMNAFLSPKQ